MRIIDSLDKSEVNEQAIAYMLYNANSHIQKRLFKVFVYLIRHWAINYDADYFDPESEYLAVTAKRIHETLERYGYFL